jgi:electron transport complex protein RnfE
LTKIILRVLLKVVILLFDFYTPMAWQEGDSMQTGKTFLIWWDIFWGEVVERNWVFKLMIGLCPALAVSTSVANCISMGVAATFALVCSSVLISAIKKHIPDNVRIVLFIAIIAAFVTMVEYFVHAFSLELYEALGAFLALIVVNCILLGHAESYAYKNSILATAINAFGTGVGFTFALLCIGAPREILGNGTLLGYNVVWENFQPWLIFYSPSGGFLMLVFCCMIIKLLELQKNKPSLNKKEGCHE